MLRLGEQNIKGLFLGDQEIARAYLGSALVYENAPYYTITASIDPDGSGTVTGVGKYKEGTQVTMIANPVEGYKFVEWKGTYVSRLPEGYTELEYIQTDGYTRIPTGLRATIDNTRLVLDCTPTEHRDVRAYFFDSINTQTNFSYAFGLRNNETEGNMTWFSGYWGDSSSEYASFTHSFNYGERVVIDMDSVSRKLKIGNTIYSIAPATNTTVKDAGELNIGGYYPEDNAAYTQRMNIHSAQVYLNGDLKGNFVPCKDKSGTIGIFNLVDNAFYGASHGGLTAGPEVDGDVVVSTDPEYTFTVTGNRELTAVFKADKPSRLPEGYKEVEYISNPNLGYITDIGLDGTNPLSNKRIDISIRLMNTSTANYIFGAYSSYQRNSSATSLNVESTLYYFSNKITTTTAAGGGSINISDYLNQKLDITLDYENLIMSMGGKTSATLKSPSSMSLDVPMSLFAYRFIWRIGSSIRSDTYARQSNFELYSMKISSGDNVLNEWVPCINPDGLVGIYDIVNDVFQSSGDSTKPFAAGPEV